MSKPATKTQARELLVKLLSEKQQGQIVKLKPVKYGEFLELWHAQYCAAKELSAGTQRIYRNGISHIAPDLGNTEIAKITAAQIQELLANKRKDYSASTIHNIYKVLNLSFKHAVKWGHLNTNPMGNVVKPARPRPHIEYWTEEEAKTFMDVAKESPHFPLLRLALGTGMRKAEILSLKGQHVDHDNCTVTIVDAKTPSGWRTIDVSPTVIACLPQREKNEPLFPGKYGKGLTPRAINYILDGLIKKTTLSRITFHGLRHTFATIMLSRGANPRDLAETLGHANPSQLWQTYAHLLPKKRKEAARMMDDLLE